MRPEFLDLLHAVAQGAKIWTVNLDNKCTPDNGCWCDDKLVKVRLGKNNTVVHSIHFYTIKEATLYCWGQLASVLACFFGTKQHYYHWPRRQYKITIWLPRQLKEMWATVPFLQFIHDNRIFIVYKTTVCAWFLGYFLTLIATMTVNSIFFFFFNHSWYEFLDVFLHQAK